MQGFSPLSGEPSCCSFYVVPSIGLTTYLDTQLVQFQHEYHKQIRVRRGEKPNGPPITLRELVGRVAKRLEELLVSLCCRLAFNSIGGDSLSIL